MSLLFKKNDGRIYDDNWLVDYISMDPSFNISRFDPLLITGEIALRVIEKVPSVICHLPNRTDKMVKQNGYVIREIDPELKTDQITLEALKAQKNEMLMAYKKYQTSGYLNIIQEIDHKISVLNMSVSMDMNTCSCSVQKD